MSLTPELQALADKLTHLQRMTVINLVQGGMSQRAAYFAAGGEAKDGDVADASAARMLADVRVREFYDALIASTTNKAIMTREEALERLSSFARTDLADLVEFGEYEIGSEDGQPVIQASWKIKDSVLQDAKKMAVISELTAGRDGIKIKTHSPLQAMQQLAKMQGWESATKHEITGKNGEPIRTISTAMTPKEAAEAYAATLHSEE